MKYQKEILMATSTLHLTTLTERANSQWHSLCKLSGTSALLQLVCVLTSTVIAILVGTEPADAEAYFSILQQNRLAGLLRLDFTTLILICLYPLTSFGMYAALRDTNKAYASLAVALIFVGTTLALAPHSAFSMIRLSDQFAVATSVVQQEQLLAAGEAVISSDMWHSTSGFLAGFFLQGGSVIISVVMLGSTKFNKATGITGILSNGFDLVHVFVALFNTKLAVILLYISGPFYLLWFPLLARDLIKLGRRADG
jgi:hypothetical protein